MNNIDITLSFNELRLNALREYLEPLGFSVEEQLQKTFDEFYESMIPEDERAKIEKQISELEEAEKLKADAARRFAVIHLHEGDDDNHFTTEYDDSFYRAAIVYTDDIRGEVGRLTLDSLAQEFSEHQLIDDLTFSVLCNAKPYDQRITAILEFDFDDGKINVCDNTDGVWKTFSLDDVVDAVNKARSKPDMFLETRNAIFNTALDGKEVLTSEPTENIGLKMQ